MAQVGSFVPAVAAEMTVMDGMYTRMGASDNLALGASTFLEEMAECSAILAAATPRSLVAGPSQTVPSSWPNRLFAHQLYGKSPPVKYDNGRVKRTFDILFSVLYGLQIVNIVVVWLSLPVSYYTRAVLPWHTVYCTSVPV